MIQMSKYSKEFEKIYVEKVFGFVDKTFRRKIVQSMKKYFPKDFFTETECDLLFKKLILSEYRELRKIYIYIRMISKAEMQAQCFCAKTGKFNKLYQDYYDMFESVRDCHLSKEKMNVRIVRESAMLTCPYCNRDYINSRGKGAAGAQLDHFYNRANFPIFSLCLYNLVPSCGNCNRIKSSQKERLLSPYDTSIDFDKELTFGYEPDEPERYEDIRIQIAPSKKMQNNFSVFKLKEAYQIHDREIQELVKKHNTYVTSQIEELYDVVKEGEIEVTREEIKEMIFGPEIRPEKYGERPLSKLRHDIMKKLEIY